MARIADADEALARFQEAHGRKSKLSKKVVQGFIDEVASFDSTVYSVRRLIGDDWELVGEKTEDREKVGRELAYMHGTQPDADFAIRTEERRVSQTGFDKGVLERMRDADPAET